MDRVMDSGPNVDLEMSRRCWSGRVAQAGQRLNPALRRYLREWRVRDLDDTRLRVAEAVSSRPEPPGLWKLADRLTEDDERALVASYLGGATQKALAEQYGMSRSSLKRLLNKHGARKLQD